MVRRSRIRQWLGTAIVLALAGGLLWTAVRYVERVGGAAAAAKLDEAMSKAARQRELTP